MAAPQDRRRLAIIGGVGAGLVALVLIARLLSGGGGGGGTADTTFVPELPVVTTTTTTVPAPEVPGGSFDVFATKDPFAPVVQIDTGGGGVGPTGATGATGSTGFSGGGSVNPSAGTAVAVVDVLDQSGTTVAQIRVGSTVYTVTTGESFATSYMVVSISGQCVQLLYGDAPFQLCKGEEVIK